MEPLAAIAVCVGKGIPQDGLRAELTSRQRKFRKLGFVVPGFRSSMRLLTCYRPVPQYSSMRNILVRGFMGFLLSGSPLLVSAVEPVLPDPFTAMDGTRVRTAAAWQSGRRGELLELFRREVYGRAPVERPVDLASEVTDITTGMMDGAATRKLVRITWSGPNGNGGMNLIIFVPTASKKPAACLLFICNREPKNIDPTRKEQSEFWPAEAIIARGYATATFIVGDVAPDANDGNSSGVHATFDPKGDARAADAWGTLAAWAWGASRAVDYLVTDPDLDPKRVAVAGHSRAGKSALWCGAQDERVALTISNNSGCGGAAVARGTTGETVAVINQKFPHWFNANYKRWNNREVEMPVDQHQLLALCAPRLVYVASATEDANADPAAEFRACVEASPVWSLFNRTGLAAKVMPSPGQPIHDGRVGYHLRAGEHNLTEADWKLFMDYTDQHLR